MSDRYYICIECRFEYEQPISTCPDCGGKVIDRHDAENIVEIDNECPECGCDLSWEVLDDELYQISGGRDSRELRCSCSCCGYSERVWE
jgi:DNA-directed RNA polymerase subunit RPC12/RpoP